MSINEDVSFTEYLVMESTQDFVTNFDTIGGATDVVRITVDGVLTDTPESSYTVQQINQTTWRITPEVQTGSVVRLYRVTNIDEMMYVFTAGAKFIARNMDSNFKQIRHAQQEVRDTFSSLETSTSMRLDSFSDQVDNLNSEFLYTQGVVSNLVIISADTVNTANNALSTANAIDAKASTALSNSSTALSTANGVDAKATDALDNSLAAVLDASEALNTANSIDAKATQALTDSATALSSATTALNTANAIDGKATQAQSDATEALSTVNNAVTKKDLGVPLGVATLDAEGKIPTSQLNAATTTVQGLIKLATSAEVNTATDATLAVTPSTLLSGVKNHLNVSGNAPMYACRAWIDFNGSGTPSINASGNFSSITDKGTGNYTLNFTRSMPSSNYVVSEIHNSVGGGQHAASITSRTSSSVTLQFTQDLANSYPAVDPTTVLVSIIR